MKKEIKILFLISILLIVFTSLINISSATNNPNSGKVKIMFIGDSVTSAQGTNSYRYWIWTNLSSSYNMSNIDFVGSQKDATTGYDGDHEGHSGWTAQDFLYGTKGASAVDYFETYNPDIVFINLGFTELYPDKHYNYTNIVKNISMIIDQIRAINPYTTFFVSSVLLKDSSTYYPYSWSNDNIRAFNSLLQTTANNKSNLNSKINFINYGSSYYSVSGGSPSYSSAKYMGQQSTISLKSYWNTCTSVSDYANTQYDFCKSNYWCGKANSTLLKPNIIMPDNLSIPITTGNIFLCAADKNIYRCGSESNLVTPGTVGNIVSGVINIINGIIYNYYDTFSTPVGIDTKKGFFTCFGSSGWQYCNNNKVCEANLGETLIGCNGDCYVPPVCQFNYTSWSECAPCSSTSHCAGNGTQTRTISVYPSGCNGGTPEATTRNCTYVAPQYAPNYLCTPNSTVSCNSLNYGYYTGYSNMCNSNGSAYLNVSTCTPYCNTGYKLVGSGCVFVQINYTYNNNNQTNATINTTNTTNQTDFSNYPVYNSSSSNNSSNSSYVPNNDYSDQIDNDAVNDILNINSSDSDLVEGNNQNSSVGGSNYTVIITIIIIVLAIILLSWWYFKKRGSKSNQNTSPPAMTQNNNFRPMPPSRPVMNPRMQPQRFNNIRQPIRPVNFRPIQRT